MRAIEDTWAMPSLDSYSVWEHNYGVRTALLSGIPRLAADSAPAVFRVVPIEEHLYARAQTPTSECRRFLLHPTRVSGEPAGHGAATVVCYRRGRRGEKESGLLRKGGVG